MTGLPDTAAFVPVQDTSPEPSLGSESICLSSLVHHSLSVPHDLQLGDLERVFRDNGVSFLALTREGRVSGLCSRERLGVLLGARFGFALNAKAPAHAAQVDEPLVFERGTPVRKVLSVALGRRGHAFHEDVVLVDAEHRILGLIPSERLANLQTRLVAEQVGCMRRQNEQLRRSAQALEEARGLWMGLFDSSLIGVCLVRQDGSFVSMNRRCAEQLNLRGVQASTVSLRDLLGSETPASLLSGSDVGCHRVERRLQVPGRGERLFKLDITWISETSQYCLCLDDITSQRELETRMKQREKQQLFDTLVAGIAHELNNKITPVLGFADLLLDSERDGTNRTFLDCIKSSMTDSAAIIRQLLQLSKPETGTLNRVDLSHLLDEVLLMLKYQICKAGVRLDRRAEPPGPVWVLADATQIKQVLINLVINALHAMEGRERRVLEAGVEFSVTEGLARVRVKDSGCGIPRAIITRIFDPFFTTKGPDRGTGLGLSVCLSIARHHKGMLSVDSEPEKGSSFVLSLPLEASARPFPELEGGYLIRPPESLQGPSAHQTFPRSKVLIVEDEANVRRMMAEMIERRFQCQVDEAPDGARGLELACRGSYDLVLSDVRMPEMCGGELYNRLSKARPDLARRFVLTTGYAGQKAEEEALSSLELPVLRKPFTVTGLIDFCSPYLRAG